MTHEEFQQLAAAGGPTTTADHDAVRQHVGSCSECLSVEREQPVAEVEGRSPVWLLSVPAIFFLALWIWREAGVRVAREQLRSERAEVVELTNAERVLKDQKEKLAEELALISAPGVQTIALTAPTGQAAGTLYIDGSSHRGVLATRSLPITDDEHDYQVWFYPADGTAPQGGAIFDATNGHTTVSVADVPAALKTVSVTLEKNGGAPQPGADVVLSGHP